MYCLMDKQTTTLINNRMKEFEARQKVRAIEARFTSNSVNLVKPHRSLVLSLCLFLFVLIFVIDRDLRIPIILNLTLSVFRQVSFERVP